jgi:hypothetical protein
VRPAAARGIAQHIQRDEDVLQIERLAMLALQRMLVKDGDRRVEAIRQQPPRAYYHLTPKGAGSSRPRSRVQKVTGAIVV